MQYIQTGMHFALLMSHASAWLPGIVKTKIKTMFKRAHLGQKAFPTHLDRLPAPSRGNPSRW